jgi:hypothetical protein
VGRVKITLKLFVICAQAVLQSGKSLCGFIAVTGTLGYQTSEQLAVDGSKSFLSSIHYFFQSLVISLIRQYSEQGKGEVVPVLF